MDTKCVVLYLLITAASAVAPVATGSFLWLTKIFLCMSPSKHMRFLLKLTDRHI